MDYNIGGDKFCEKKLTFNNSANTDHKKHIRKSTFNSKTHCNPLYSDHVARFYQRITDIFEKDESTSNGEEESHKNLPASDIMRKPRASYRTVLEDVKDLEVKYKKMNEEAEKRRTKTELDYLRPGNYLQSRKYEADKDENKFNINEDIPFDKYHKKKIESFKNIAKTVNRSTMSDLRYSRTANIQHEERTDNSYYSGSNFLRRFVMTSLVSGHSLSYLL